MEEVPQGRAHLTIDGEQLEVDLGDRPWMADLLARAEHELHMADAFYRKWRAECTMELVASKPKWAEWRIRAHIESTEDFLRYKEAAGVAQQNVTFLRVVLQQA